MFRWLYRVGILLGAAILALFIGAKLIYLFDPYRIVTEELIQQVALESQQTVRLNEYGTVAVEIRQMLHTEEVAAWAGWLDQANVPTLIDLIPFRSNVTFVVGGVDTAVHKIAAFDDDLESIEAATVLSRDLVQLRFYDLDQGDKVLAGLYEQSQTVSHSLTDVSEGLEDVETAVTAVTTMPAIEAIQQELVDVRNTATSIAAGDAGLFSWVIPQEAASEFIQLADFINGSIESWRGMPSNIQATRQRIDTDVAWLDDFEQQYVQAEAFNDRWHFDTLRLLPRFVAGNYQPLLLGVIGSLLLAIVGWVGSLVPARVPQTQPCRPVGPPILRPTPPKPHPSLAFLWPDGRCDRQPLPQSGEVTVGNVIIRRARVRYYLERLDNAFPTLLNGQSIRGARILNDGDVLQIGELQTTFQLAAS